MTEGAPTTSVVRSSAQISALTFVARLAGFARWIVLGYAVGTTFLGNVYQTANLLPNVIFELVAGGLLASVLVPTFVREMDRGGERIGAIASSLTNLLLLISIPLVVVGVVFARPVMAVLLVGVTDEATKAEQVALGAWFLRFFLPQIPLYLVGMVMQGILHAHRRFVIAALAPLLSSLTVIATYLAFRSMGGGDLSDRGPAMVVLAGGTTIGVLVLTFCQLPSVVRLGIRWRPLLDLRDPVVRGALRAGGWGAGYLGVTQLIMLAAAMVANRVEGGVVAFQIANAFFELPNALIGMPIALSLFPALSEASGRGQDERFATLLMHGWRVVLFGAMPAAVGLYLVAPLLADVALGWAELVSPSLVAATLQGLAIGVPPWLAMQTLVRAFYARGATAWPFVLNLAAFATLLAIVGTALALYSSRGTHLLRILGSAVGSGWWIAAVLGIVMLARSVPELKLRPLLSSLLVNAARAVAVGAVVWIVLNRLPGPRLLALAVAALAAAMVVGASGLLSAELRASFAFLGRGVQTREA